MELRQYLLLARRWFWLLLLGTLLGAASAYIGSSFQTPVYKTESQVLVSLPSREQLSDMGYLNSYQLIQTYSQLLVTTPILDDVSERLDYRVEKAQISTQLIRDTQILEISVEDKDPMMAADIANLLSEVLVEYNEQLQASRYEALEESLSSQIKVVETQINDLQTEIDQNSLEIFEERKLQMEEQIDILQSDIVNLQLEISELTPRWGKPDAQTQTLINQKQLQLDQTQGMLDLYQELYFNIVSTMTNGDSSKSPSGSENIQAQTNLALYQQMYASLLSDYEAVRLARLENTPTVVQVESAKIKSVPIRPQPLTNTLLGGVVGLMIAGGIIFLIEYLDDTIKTPEDVTLRTKKPILGYIAEIQGGGRNNMETLYVCDNPRSPVAEAFRTLRTNIELFGRTEPVKSILITSPGPREGKSTISSNLAMVMMQGGKRVVLLDADLRNPTIHRKYKLQNRLGLSEYLNGENGFNQIIKNVDDFERLLVIPSGKLPSSPAEMLNSEKMDQLMEIVLEVADYVIIDSPPLVVTDPVILSAKADGILLVVQPELTKQNALIGSIEQLDRANARLLGVVFNRITRRTAYYYQHYYSNYYSSYHYFSKEEVEDEV